MVCGYPGVTTGPGRGPADFEHMQRRHRHASAAMLHTLASAYAWHQPAICPPTHTSARAFTKRVEVCKAIPPVSATAPNAPLLWMHSRRNRTPAKWHRGCAWHDLWRLYDWTWDSDKTPPDAAQTDSGKMALTLCREPAPWN